MAYETKHEIASKDEILKQLPLDAELESFLEKENQEIKDILSGKDDRKILIIGPCSAWPDTAVLKYASILKDIADSVKDKVKIVMRLYTQKPRTTVGWTGPMIQPDPLSDADINLGIRYCRKMMIEVLKIGLPLASESLFLDLEPYYSDLISYAAIGARTTESQEHRQYASMIDIPVGLKNPTSGKIDIAINSIVAAQNPHAFAFEGSQVRSSGNPHAHLILRGGYGGPNISRTEIDFALETMIDNAIINPAVIIDASHENSVDIASGKKDPLLQSKVINDILKMKLDFVKGFMVESFMKSGNQKITSQQAIDLDGLSITDACIGIDETRKLINMIYGMID
ncbi:MAG: 3-deoxy-7-phosphoheptulonate synthase [Nanoarchaeota archaeon]